jgi:hypothetical protein
MFGGNFSWDALLFLLLFLGIISHKDAKITEDVTKGKNRWRGVRSVTKGVMGNHP